MPGSIRWADVPADDDDGDNGDDTRAHGAIVDESVAERRLRRWLKGMFGGKEQETSERPKEEPED
jgi:hypothetical protein